MEVMGVLVDFIYFRVFFCASASCLGLTVMQWKCSFAVLTPPLVTPCIPLVYIQVYAGHSVGVKRWQKEGEGRLGGLGAEKSSKFVHYWAILVKEACLLAEIL